MVLFRAKVNRVMYSLAMVFKKGWMGCAGVETPANLPIPVNASLAPGFPVPRPLLFSLWLRQSGG
jgi:hypothetical protein